MAWQHTDSYDLADDLVQVQCRVLPDKTRDAFTRSCDLAVSSGDHATGDLFVSIGHANDDGEWFVAGWNMAQDCWQDARCFEVISWQPLASITEPSDE